MREFPADNISLLRQLESVQVSTPIQTLGPTCPRLHYVSILAIWVYCFLGYIAILTTDPRTRDQLAYAELIIRVAQRRSGQCRMDND